MKYEGAEWGFVKEGFFGCSLAEAAGEKARHAIVVAGKEAGERQNSFLSDFLLY